MRNANRFFQELKIGDCDLRGRFLRRSFRSLVQKTSQSIKLKIVLITDLVHINSRDRHASMINRAD
jgi:hypothetical protein